MSIEIPSEREVNEIRGKLMVNAATKEEINKFFRYEMALLSLVEEASMEDFYGTEGYEHRLGWD